MEKNLSEKVKQELQEKMFQLEVYREQIQAYQEQVNLVVNTITQFTTTQQAVKQLNSMDENILINLGSGFFVNAKLKNRDKLLMHVGGDVILPKTRDECLRAIEEQLSKLNSNREKTEKILEELILQAEKLRDEITQIITDIQKNQQGA